MQFQDKVYVITGTNLGIGKALAQYQTILTEKLYLLMTVLR